jgi:hypothetical protein
VAALRELRGAMLRTRRCVTGEKEDIERLHDSSKFQFAAEDS